MSTVAQLSFPRDSEGIPNNPTLPVVIHHGVEEIVDDPAACERLFQSHGWGGNWRNGIFPFHHFHSNAHEVLGIVSGAAKVTLGGPGGERLTVEAGDVLVLPAGTGHKREDSGSGLLVIGGYPAGQENYDTGSASGGLMDLGDRFRLLLGEVDVVPPDRRPRLMTLAIRSSAAVFQSPSAPNP
jgi:uncharacterized protein YjlB